ncbi:hypothetical protein L9F63_019000, partial [Diploptera punctata]
ISAKTQILFAIVFTTRYLDLFTNYISVYISVYKILNVAVTYVTVMSIYFKFKDPDRGTYDTF